MEYTGNAIYDYINRNQLDYYYSARNMWLLLYGTAESIPKILVMASKVGNIRGPLTEKETEDFPKALLIADNLKLPLIYVRFSINSNEVLMCESTRRKWYKLTYDQLEKVYAQYGIKEEGNVKKEVNQYVSSPYHRWQREKLGSVIATDLDLLKCEDGKIKEMIELKRSREKIYEWMPYPKDFSNFALIINAISGSGKKIPFRLYYNELKPGPKGKRKEDISKIKVFEFEIPDGYITSRQVRYQPQGFYKLEQLL